DDLADVDESITYSFEVTNTGTVTMTGVSITDPRVTGISPATADIAPGQTVTFTAAPYVVVQADVDAGGVFNEATALGTPPGSVPFTPPTDSVTVPTPSAAALTAAKSAAVDDINANGLADAGETIVYTVTLTNTGDLT